uniref:Uncharacterized protein n=1 Tax=Vespula pensylvanica TaxID=30213 RepID=A0A834U8D8_VESPE|nr:hypothetical protein H0235_009336 [Vespula pensylvanica]
MWTNITKIPYYSISICYAWILFKSSFQNRDSRLELSRTSFSTLVEDKKERRYALSMEQRSKASPFGESRAHEMDDLYTNDNDDDDDDDGRLSPIKLPMDKNLGYVSDDDDDDYDDDDCIEKRIRRTNSIENFSISRRVKGHD